MQWLGKWVSYLMIGSYFLLEDRIQVIFLGVHGQKGILFLEEKLYRQQCPLEILSVKGSSELLDKKWEFKNAVSLSSSFLSSLKS